MPFDFRNELRSLLKLACEQRDPARAYTLRLFSHVPIAGQKPPNVEAMTEWDHQILRLIYDHRADEALSPNKLVTLLKDRETLVAGDDERPQVHASKVSQVIARLENRYRLVSKEGRNAKPRLTEFGEELCRCLEGTESLVVPGIARLIEDELGEADTQRVSSAVADAIRRFRKSPPSATMAGVYDCLLGGRCHTILDRDVALDLKRRIPFARNAAIANRAFLRRAIQFVSLSGIRQFIDIGSGLPTVGNTHEVAHLVNPEAKVVYVDSDPVVVEESNRLLRHERNAETLCHRAENIDAILNDAFGKCGLNHEAPVAVLLVAILHFIKDDPDVQRIMQTIRRRVPDGSLLVISHGAIPPPESPTSAEELQKVYGERVHDLRLRSEAEITDLFEGAPLVSPGKLVFTTLWHPEVPDRFLSEDDKKALSGDDAWKTLVYAGVGRITKEA